MSAEHTARRIATDQSGPLLVDHFASSARKASPSVCLRGQFFGLSDHTTTIPSTARRGPSADSLAVQLRWNGATCSTRLPTKRGVRLRHSSGIPG